jgi:DNA-binding NarL/FixJ family response regulator
LKDVSVLLADPHPFVRMGVRSILERDSGFRVVAEAEDGDAAISLALRLSPGLVVLGRRLPAVNGVDATRRILKARPQTTVVILSADEDADSVAAALRAGARGYVSKQSDPRELVATVRAAVAGQIAVCGRLSHRDDSGARSRTSAADDAAPVLNERDRSILQLVAEGHSNRSIAARLHRSVKTIEAARTRLTRKLGVFSVAELTKYALRHGLTSIDS